MIGKRELLRARSSLSGLGDGAVVAWRGIDFAGVFLVPSGIAKWLRRLAGTLSAKPLSGWSKFLGMVIRWVFTETDAYRLWLDFLADNVRARHVYLSHGFVEEGLSRNAYKLTDDNRIDLVLMSLLRPDWRLRSGQELG
jgi:hypothetical protein